LQVLFERLCFRTLPGWIQQQFGAGHLSALPILWTQGGPPGLSGM
jgi:hypothetical protein